MKFPVARRDTDSAEEESNFNHFNDLPSVVSVPPWFNGVPSRAWARLGDLGVPFGFAQGRAWRETAPTLRHLVCGKHFCGILAFSINRGPSRSVLLW